MRRKVGVAAGNRFFNSRFILLIPTCRITELGGARCELTRQVIAVDLSRLHTIIMVRSLKGRGGGYIRLWVQFPHYGLFCGFRLLRKTNTSKVQWLERNSAAKHITVYLNEHLLNEVLKYSRLEVLLSLLTANRI